MAKAGGDPRALAAVLERISGGIEPGAKILLDHPQTRDRVAAITRAAAGDPAGESIVTPDQWSALQRICSGS
jgi:hypothetical protein